MTATPLTTKRKMKMFKLFNRILKNKNKKSEMTTEEVLSRFMSHDLGKPVEEVVKTLEKDFPINNDEKG